MVWFADVGEFVGSFTANFIERRARTKSRTWGSTKADADNAAYTAVTKGLEDCLPMQNHVTQKGLNEVCKSLKKNDHFAAQLAIDANPGLRKRDICVALLKLSVTCLCGENPTDLVSSATYSMIARK